MTILQRLTLTRPDDWHLHLRSGPMLRTVLPATSACFARAIIMPNLQPPVVRPAQAQAYRQEILAALPAGQAFQPLMTLYLTETTDPEDVRTGFQSGTVAAVKLYPAGATTNSDAGVQKLERVYPVLAVMEEIGMPLLIHGEVVDPAVDIFDREAVFIETRLIPLRTRFPALKVVFEHLTTREGVDYVRACPHPTAATITPHHLVINRNAMLVGGIRPHYYCLPVAKRETHRRALVEAATSGDSRFFMGTDSAPHPDDAKLRACGCAGIFNAPNAIAVTAQLFEQENALAQLEGFLSRHGADFYGLPPNPDTLTLERLDQAQPVPKALPLEQGQLSVFDPQMPVYWRVAA
ncbi:MAG TPA: dihydroorotase [Thiolinea sp.]|nr:dihydroorotase [Thiolinea sp.]